MWDVDESLWWDGTILSEIEPHSPELYGFGHWEITDGLNAINIKEG